MPTTSIAKFSIILSLFLFIGCRNFSVTKDNIKIIKIEKHPFLVDHKKMIVTEYNDKIVDKAKGYIDSGIGCNTHLFEENDKFILIDCNGTIFNISKKGGEIINKGWSWMQKLPEKYIGFFKMQKGNVEYKLVSNSSPTLEEVYQIKDPND